MKAFSAHRFPLELPLGHRFPAGKYRLLHQRVQQECPDIELLEPSAAGDELLALAHDGAYVQRVNRGQLSANEQRVLGLPWSASLAERARRSVGATVAACRAALVDGIAASLAGGTHHAHRAHAAGYCLFNDAAIAARLLTTGICESPKVARIAIIDLDVHQGDGTAEILAGDRSVFTLSIHAQSNYPARKKRSRLDVALPDGTGDRPYLDALDRSLGQLQQAFAPDFVIYLAGADAHEDDRLGRLKLSIAGLAQRDQRVLDFARANRAPIALTMAGGYGRDINTTVAIHLQTLQLASRMQRSASAAHLVHG